MQKQPYGKAKVLRHKPLSLDLSKLEVDVDKLNEITAEVVEVTRNGVCFAVDAKQRTFAFRLNRLEKYKGEKPSDVGLEAGQTIKMSVKNGDVVGVAQPQ